MTPLYEKGYLGLHEAVKAHADITQHMDCDYALDTSGIYMKYWKFF